MLQFSSHTPWCFHPTDWLPCPPRHWQLWPDITRLLGVALGHCTRTIHNSNYLSNLPWGLGTSNERQNALLLYVLWEQWCRVDSSFQGECCPPACLASGGKQAIYLPVSVHLNFVKTCAVQVSKNDVPVKCEIWTLLMEGRGLNCRNPCRSASRKKRNGAEF